MNAHLSPDTIAGYFSDTLSHADQLVAEAHVADCDLCALGAQEVFAADTVVDHWTARLHGVASRRHVLAYALDLVGQQATAPSIRARLAAWADTIAEQAEEAVRVLLEVPTQAAFRLARQASDLTRPAPSFQFAGAAMPIRGPAQGGASRGAAQPIVVQAGGAGGPTAQVAVSGGRREVVVRLDGVPRGSEPPLVLLVRATTAASGAAPARSASPSTDALQPGIAMAAAAPPPPAPVSPPPPLPARAAAFSPAADAVPALDAEPPASPDARLAVPMPSPGSDAWIARFDGLDEGEYLVLFEPRP